MQRIVEIKRLTSPAPKPQALAWDGRVLWMGSRQTKDIFALEPASWTVKWQTAAPGTPYGMTVVNGELRVLCGETADDHRIIRRCIPNQGFDASWAIPCPDDTGSQLGYDGHSLYVSQWYPKKVIQLGPKGEAQRVLVVPHEICGQVIVDGLLYLVTTDNEETTDYWLTRCDLRSTTPKFDDIAHIPFAARALTFDGERFWTNHREQNEMVCFAAPH